MSDTRFRVGDRLRAFLLKFRSPNLKAGETSLYLAGWLFSLAVILFARSLGAGSVLFYGMFIFFWFKLAGLLDKHLSPPNELLILLWFLLELVELGLLNSIYAGLSPNIAVQIPQFLNLAIQILLFSLILVRNSKGKRWVLIVYLLLCAVGMTALKSPRLFHVFAFHVVLFLFLLRKTTWLEELTKLECWAYLLMALGAFRYLLDVDLYRSIQPDQLDQPVLWFLMPRFLHALLKMYLLAVLVKIPIVLVYNFAKLSGKLRISGLFQSTFPQIIQLVMLLIIFYFFIAGWQAEKVRQALVTQAEQIAEGLNGDSIQSFRERMRLGRPIRVGGYQQIRAPASLPARGILSLASKGAVGNLDANASDYFFFTKSADTDSIQFFNMVKLDLDFLQTVTDNASILAGSALVAYPYDPPNWESFILQATFFDREQAFRIFPFGLAPDMESEPLSVLFRRNVQHISPDLAEVKERLDDGDPFSIGRIIAPVFDADGDQTRFFSLDIVLLPDLSFFTSTLSSYILLLLIGYALVNFVVVKRMVKFGSEINRIIVQKFNQLRKGIREIASGNLDYKVKVEGEDEFVELAERFNQMGDKLKESITEAREKERLQQELAIARQVQLDMLPATLPDIQGFKIAATLKTANAVGGDFYDVVQLDDDQFLFTIGDVSGKSTSAAFYMAQCICLFRYSQQFTGKPHEIATRLNRYFSDPMIDRQVFITAIIGLVDVKSGSLRFVRAGHPPPFLLPAKKSQKIEEVKFQGLGIGLQRTGDLFEKHLEDGVLNLETGDSVVFYTDGIVEASRPNPGAAEAADNELQFYGEEQFIRLLQGMRGHGASEILNKVTAELDAFYNGAAPVDDYTLLVIQKK